MSALGPGRLRDAPPAPDALEPAALGFGVWGGPVAAVVAYMGGIVSIRECDPLGFAVRAGLLALAVAVAAWAAAVSWRNWRAVRGEVREAAGGVAGRNRFVALMGLVSGGLGALISLWVLAAVLVLDRCVRA
jgi:hypothetical protein